jgi:hypothetical protein
MKHKMVETIKEDKVVYDFFWFDDWRDFDKIIFIVKDKIKPDKIDWNGLEDMNGYFEKDGLLVNLEYDSMGQNYIEFKGEQTERNLAKVREWANIIFDNLMAGLKDNK